MKVIAGCGGMDTRGIPYTVSGDGNEKIQRKNKKGGEHNPSPFGCRFEQIFPF